MPSLEQGKPERIRTPNPSDIARFTGVALGWQDPNNLTIQQAQEFDQVGQKLLDSGIPFAGVVNLW